LDVFAKLDKPALINYENIHSGLKYGIDIGDPGLGILYYYNKKISKLKK
jgi:hypothetical protein